MAQAEHKTWLMDKSWNKLALLQVQNLQYSQLINGVPQCYFEMQIQNPVFRQINFAFDDNTYNIQIERNGVIKFRGELDELAPADTRGTANDALLVMDRIGFYASHKIDHLKRLIAAPDTDAVDYKRSFNDVPLGTAAQTLMQEAIVDKTNSPLSDITIGTIENPVDETGAVINLTSDQFLYAESIFNWIDLLAVLGDADYWIDDDNKFNFVKRKGQDRPNAAFRLHFDQAGNNLSSLKINLNKREMANRIIVLGEGEGVFKKLADESNTQHATKYGLKEAVVPARVLATTESAAQYAKVKLKEREATDKLVMFTTVQTHEPLLGFDIGDNVTVDVNWFIYNFKKKLRIVELKTFVDQNGTESFAYQTDSVKK
jgi:hypothetical protein